MTQEKSKSSATEEEGELSEQQLTEVTGGDDKSKTNTKANSKGGDSSTSIGPVVISIIGVLIS